MTFRQLYNVDGFTLKRVREMIRKQSQIHFTGSIHNIAQSFGQHLNFFNAQFLASGIQGSN